MANEIKAKNSFILKSFFYLCVDVNYLLVNGFNPNNVLLNIDVGFIYVQNSKRLVVLNWPNLSDHSTTLEKR